jgi:hypothetical protein
VRLSNAEDVPRLGRDATLSIADCALVDCWRTSAILKAQTGRSWSRQTLAVNWTALKGGIEAHLDRVKAELGTLESGDVRRGTRHRNGPWQDTTVAVIHEARNLMATLEALLQIVSYLEITQMRV